MTSTHLTQSAMTAEAEEGGVQEEKVKEKEELDGVINSTPDHHGDSIVRKQRERRGEEEAFT